MKRRLRWVVLGGIAVGAAVFAVQGGEYGTTDLLSQASRKRTLERQIDSLRREIDSLSRVKRAVLSDPATQERIAREEFGMVKGEKEILYRFAEPPDSVRNP
jgi:cell division protein FtsB